MKKFWPSAVLLTAPVFLASSTQAAETLRGAQATLQAAQALATTPTTAATPTGSSAAEDDNAWTQFQARAAQLRQDVQKPDAQNNIAALAEEWLKLARELPSVRKASGQGRQPDFRDVARALPPPAAWPLLVKGAEADVRAQPNSMHTQALALFTHRLVGDELAQSRDLHALTALIEPQLRGMQRKWQQTPVSQRRALNLQQQPYYYILPDVAEFMADQPSFGWRRKAVEWKLALFPLSSSNWNSNQGEGIAVPDVVAVSTPALATPIISKALFAAAPVRFEGSSTQKVARQLASQHLAQLKSPRFDLISAPAHLPLFWRMERRFPTRSVPEEERYNYNPQVRARDEARAVALADLVRRGKVTEAVKTADAWLRVGWTPDYSGALSLLQQEGHEVALWEFYRGVLAKHPKASSWESDFSYLSKSIGRSEIIPGRDSGGDQGLRMRARSLSQANQPAAAAAIWMKLMQRPLPKTDDTGTLRDQRRSDIRALLNLSRAVRNTQWAAAATNAALKLAQSPDQNNPWQMQGDAGLLLEVAREGSPARAESGLGQMLKRALQPPRESFHASGPDARYPLLALTTLYHEASRPRDVLLMLEGAAGWRATDLGAIMSLSNGQFTDEENKGTTLGFMAARALAQTGRRDAAVRVLQAMLRQKGGYDAAYQLLVSIQGNGAMPFLQALQRRDPFEERPLIWQAHLLRRSGKLVEAEKATRAAIAIDPSDGEQPHGDRMRVYAELAAIRRARGDKEEAAQLDRVVRAIRQSETADDLWQAGLTNRAIALYESSLAQFAGAYCIQSRLALRLSNEGRWEEAAAHYRRAYELMPSSFGRVESHCFGCEGVFQGTKPRNIADQVFTRLATQLPRNPRVNYLLGYLREAQDRQTEAQTLFLRAVALDPAYLSAWNKLYGRREALPKEQQEKPLFALANLDPLRRHSDYSLLEARDWRKVWAAVKTSLARRGQNPGNLLPLRGTQARIVQDKIRFKQLQAKGESVWMMDADDSESNESESIIPYTRVEAPADAIIAQRRFSVFSRLLTTA